MISLNRRAEKQVLDALLANSGVMSVYGRNKIFQGFAAPNTLANLNEYVLIQRISANALDRATDGTETNKLRRVRIQIDISDIDYVKMVNRAEMTMGALETAFPSSIDGDTYGTVTAGQKVFNVCSIDVILTESEV
jgi:hypothetical protein